MPNRLIPYVKVLVHLLCLAPFVYLLRQWRTGALDLDADPVASITHFTGDWALWLLLVSLAVTPVRRLHPSLSNLIRFRRLLGLYAFFYASLHLATYIFLFSGYDIQTAYAGLKHGHLAVLWQQWLTVWPSVVDDLKKRRFIQVGLFAWVLLLALAVTSPNVMLRKLGGKNWQRLHRLVYLAAFAACVHYWWLVKTGVRTPWKDTAVLFALLLARLVWSLLKLRRKPTATRPPIAANESCAPPSRS
jgi:sulfoxide reductase heme-binding subunit YedZ